MVLIKYFVPEDGDDQSHPNVFPVKSDYPSLAEIKKSFALPGAYHWRFLKSVGSYNVWLDLIDESAIAPTFEGGIFAKVSRLESDISNGTTKTVSPPQPSFAHTSEPRPSPVNTARNTEQEGLLKFDDFNDPSNVSKSSSSANKNIFDVNDDLLGMSSAPTNSSVPPKANSKSELDLFGMDTLHPATSSSSSGGAGGLHTSSSATGMSSLSSSSSSGWNSTAGIASNKPGATTTTNNMGMGMGAPPRAGSMGLGLGQQNPDPFSGLGGISSKNGVPPKPSAPKPSVWP